METSGRQAGKITSIQDGQATVLIERRDACSGCAAAGACHPSSCSTLSVNARVPEGAFRPGDRVWVVSDTRSGMRALSLVYLIPLLWLALCFAAAWVAGLPETACAAASVAALLPYYIALRFREKREKRLGRDTVRIEPFIQ